MPELPEVEIAARNLRRWTDGRRVERVDADPRARWVFRPSSPAALARALEGARFGSIRRIGKHLLLSMERRGERVGLLAHLGMTGEWLRREERDPPTRFSRARFHLDDGKVLDFDDMRQFGRLRVVPGGRFEEVPEVAALGPDPLEEGIDLERLAGALARSRLPVKVRIMDQAILPGVGNIHASEALFRARIDPRRKARSLSAREVRALASGVLASLRHAIERQEDAGERGSEDELEVYGREGERCRRCRQGRVRRVVQAQRSTYYCPRCQR